jgi:hypothetical protein
MSKPIHTCTCMCTYTYYDEMIKVYIIALLNFDCQRDVAVIPYSLML